MHKNRAGAIRPDTTLLFVFLSLPQLLTESRFLPLSLFFFYENRAYSAAGYSVQSRR